MFLRDAFLVVKEKRAETTGVGDFAEYVGPEPPAKTTLHVVPALRIAPGKNAETMDAAEPVETALLAVPVHQTENVPALLTALEKNVEMMGAEAFAGRAPEDNFVPRSGPARIASPTALENSAATTDAEGVAASAPKASPAVKAAPAEDANPTAPESTAAMMDAGGYVEDVLPERYAGLNSFVWPTTDAFPNAPGSNAGSMAAPASAEPVPTAKPATRTASVKISVSPTATENIVETTGAEAIAANVPQEKAAGPNSSVSAAEEEATKEAAKAEDSEDLEAESSAAVPMIARRGKPAATHSGRELVPVSKKTSARAALRSKSAQTKAIAHKDKSAVNPSISELAFVSPREIVQVGATTTQTKRKVEKKVEIHSMTWVAPYTQSPDVADVLAKPACVIQTHFAATTPGTKPASTSAQRTVEAVGAEGKQAATDAYHKKAPAVTGADVKVASVKSTPSAATPYGTTSVSTNARSSAMAVDPPTEAPQTDASQVTPLDATDVNAKNASATATPFAVSFRGMKPALQAAKTTAVPVGERAGVWAMGAKPMTDPAATDASARVAYVKPIPFAATPPGTKPA